MSGPEPSTVVEDVLDAGGEDDPGVPAFNGLEFPGCVAVPMTSAQYEACDGHVEFWDEAAGIAMGRRLAGCWSRATDRPAGGDRGMNRPEARFANRSVPRAFPHAAPCAGTPSGHGAGRVPVPLPGASGSPSGAVAASRGERPPELVVELDHATDVRRGKLRVYESGRSRNCGWRCPTTIRRLAAERNCRV